MHVCVARSLGVPCRSLHGATLYGALGCAVMGCQLHYVVVPGLYAVCFCFLFEDENVDFVFCHFYFSELKRVFLPIRGRLGDLSNTFPLGSIIPLRQRVGGGETANLPCAQGFVMIS